jgi:hypothetical protein
MYLLKLSFSETNLYNRDRYGVCELPFSYTKSFVIVRAISVHLLVGNFSDTSWQEQVTFQWDDVHFVLDQHN